MFPALATTRQIDTGVRILSLFEAITPDEFARYDKPTKSSGHAVTLGQLEYRPVVHAFERACYENWLVQSFDWGAWSDQARKCINDAQLVGSRLHNLHQIDNHAPSAERFSDGHLAELLRSDTLAPYCDG